MKKQNIIISMECFIMRRTIPPTETFIIGLAATSQNNGTMVDDKKDHTGSATDGDMDIAYSLLLADNLWGSHGKINYKEEAIRSFMH